MELLEDELNLRLLRHLVSGEGVRVNLSAVAKHLDVHRATAKRRLNFLFENNIVAKPVYPFPTIFEKYPLLVIVRADLPRNREVIEFIKDDTHIFAGFSCMEGPYNTLLMEFFKDLESYHSWRERIVKEKKLPSRDWRSPADASIFSNKLTFRYAPNCFLEEMRKRYQDKGYVDLGEHRLNSSSFELMERLLQGDFLRTNESLLGRKLGSDRKTVGRRIEYLIDHGIISKPCCFFPNLFIPPGYNLVVTMLEARDRRGEIRDFLKRDPNVSRGIDTSSGRYNFLIFTAFRTIEDFFTWGNTLMDTFPDCIGAVSNTFLSSRMIHNIDPQKVSLGWIERRLWEEKGGTL